MINGAVSSEVCVPQSWVVKVRYIPDIGLCAPTKMESRMINRNGTNSKDWPANQPFVLFSRFPDINIDNPYKIYRNLDRQGIPVNWKERLVKFIVHECNCVVLCYPALPTN